LEIDLAALGLTSSQLNSSTLRPLTFTLAREAGSFACTGSAGLGRGGGDYVFTPNETFLGKMRERGYAGLTSDQQLRAAVVDVTVGFVDRIAAAGYGRLAYDKLVAFRAIGVDDDYIRAIRMLLSGPLVSASDMIALRALNVDVAYLSALASVGYPHVSTQEAVQLRALGIDAAYIKRVATHGFSHLPIEQLVRLKALNVISERSQELAAT
jgi:hypothetical protein